MRDCFLVSFKGHISGSSSKTAGAENGVFLPKKNREKVKFYADRDNIFLSCCVANTSFNKALITYESRMFHLTGCITLHNCLASHTSIPTINI